MEDKEVLKEITEYLRNNTETNKQLVETSSKLVETNKSLVETNRELVNVIIIKEEQEDKNIKEFTDAIKKVIYAFLICIGIIIIIFCSVII